MAMVQDYRVLIWPLLELNSSLERHKMTACPSTERPVVKCVLARILPAEVSLSKTLNP